MYADRSRQNSIPNRSCSRSSSISSSLSCIFASLTDELNESIILLLFFKDESTFPLSIADEQLKCVRNNNYHYIDDISDCIDYVQKATKEQRIFIVTASVKEAKEIVETCNTYPSLKGIYVFEQASSNILSPNTCMYSFDDWSILLQELNADMLLWRRQSLAFSFFEQEQKTIRNVTRNPASFLWSQILLNMLKEISSSEQTIDDMLNLCADYYRDNSEQLKKINACRSTYEANDAIQWYTRDTFLHRRLNAALRTEDIDAFLLFFPFIADLCNQIREEQRSHPFSVPTITVYHGQRMTREEIENLQANKDNLVSTNAFWSSSLDKEVALIYAGQGQQRSNRWSVLVQIDVDTSLKSIVFARIDQLSDIKDEREVIFSLSTVFKIIDVCNDLDKCFWHVRLQATDEAHENFIEYGHLLHHDIEETNFHLIVGSIIMAMGKFDKACAYFAELAKRLPAEDVNLQGAIRQKHGRALFYMGNYPESLKIICEGLELYRTTYSWSENPGYLRLEFNRANVYMFTCRYDEALELYEKVLRIQKKIFKPDHRHIAESLCGISWVYQKKQNYKLSIKYCKRGLDIFHRTLPPNHPSISRATCALGYLLKISGQWSRGHKLLKQGFGKCRQFLPNEHPYVAELLEAIGDDHVNRVEYGMAPKCYDRTLVMHEDTFPSVHTRVADLLADIAHLHRLRKKFKRAIEL